jgi:hypothetical protein
MSYPLIPMDYKIFVYSSARAQSLFVSVCEYAPRAEAPFLRGITSTRPLLPPRRLLWSHGSPHERLQLAGRCHTPAGGDAHALTNCKEQAAWAKGPVGAMPSCATWRRVAMDQSLRCVSPRRTVRACSRAAPGEQAGADGSRQHL